MNVIEKRMKTWDKRKVDELKTILETLYSNLFRVRNFLNIPTQPQSREAEIVAPIIPEGSVILMTSSKEFKEQVPNFVDPTSFSEFRNEGSPITSKRIGIGSIPKVEIPYLSFDRFSKPLPKTQKVTRKNFTIKGEEGDPMRVMCIPEELAARYPYLWKEGEEGQFKPVGTVADLASQGVRFDLIEKDSKSLNLDKNVPVCYLTESPPFPHWGLFTSDDIEIKIPKDVWTLNGTDNPNSTIPYSFDPFAAVHSTIVIQKTIPWFELPI